MESCPSQPEGLPWRSGESQTPLIILRGRVFFGWFRVPQKLFVWAGGPPRFPRLGVAGLVPLEVIGDVRMLQVAGPGNAAGWEPPCYGDRQDVVEASDDELADEGVGSEVVTSRTALARPATVVLDGKRPDVEKCRDLFFG